uniref:uncharacterized protein LOC122782107 n=1 Tax=Solea senegalensis TaxID=28829 RepID=UPI001CD82CBB|nr:uncharacterized protein LOC122782107 [Solea senegalensis]
MFSDDSAVVGCIRDGQEEEYRTVVADFVKWASENHLILNVPKTKEMGRKRTAPQPLKVLGEVIEMVEEYKFLGVRLNNRLDWKCSAVYRKGMSRLFFLRRLRSFDVCSEMLELFYQSVVASALFFAVVCWGSSIGASETNKLNKLIKKAGSIIGCKQDTVETVVERRMLNKFFPSWITPIILSTTSSRPRRAHSPRDSDSSAVTRTDSGSHQNLIITKKTDCALAQCTFSLHDIWYAIALLYAIPLLLHYFFPTVAHFTFYGYITFYVYNIFLYCYYVETISPCG